VTHNPSEIILICRLAAQEIFLLIINIENSCAAKYFLYIYIYDFRILCIESKKKIEIKIFCNIMNVFFSLLICCYYLMHPCGTSNF